jgi:hypothetical protein
MTEEVNRPQKSEADGLLVTYDEETLSLTFDWNPDTHPKYNYLQDLSSSELLQLITRGLEEALEEDLQNQNNPNHPDNDD